MYFLFFSVVMNGRNAFKHELTLLEKVRHPNVIQFVGAVTQNLPMMIVAEYHSKVSMLLPSLQELFVLLQFSNIIHLCGHKLDCRFEQSFHLFSRLCFQVALLGVYHPFSIAKLCHDTTEEYQCEMLE
ncbi:SERINE/THREONINE-PROTEIN KINASE HT1-LIKE [Salix koriyanagi]|uniref:SERINE/THREONINE-PROTEIN KINASE HT1-LIKE n=1 Tax=Salix koriyanagi TaxID=2511006 RepID=A0A9Q0YUD0_9ROSI|nr:SERINE/THREONINE-PROTEIN KINASE HT1-LIKE [Salix koriyanagi]